MNSNWNTLLQPKLYAIFSYMKSASKDYEHVEVEEAHMIKTNLRHRGVFEMVSA